MREPSTADLIAAYLLQKLIEPQGEPTAALWQQAEREEVGSWLHRPLCETAPLRGRG